MKTGSRFLGRLGLEIENYDRKKGRQVGEKT